MKGAQQRRADSGWWAGAPRQDAALASPPEEHQGPGSADLPNPQIRQMEIFTVARMFVPEAVPSSRPAVSRLCPKGGSKSQLPGGWGQTATLVGYVPATCDLL